MTSPMTCLHNIDIQDPCEACNALKELDVATHELARLKTVCRDKDAEIQAAMRILDPSMSEQGLVDACRQRMQAYISERDNAATAEKELEEVKERLAAVRQTLGQERLHWKQVHEGCHAERDEMKAKLELAVCLLMFARSYIERVGWHDSVDEESVKTFLAESQPFVGGGA